MHRTAAPAPEQQALLRMKGATQPPPRLTEASLIALMERHGIGTDATVAEHINKQLERGYATVPLQAKFMSHSIECTTQ